MDNTLLEVASLCGEKIKKFILNSSSGTRNNVSKTNQDKARVAVAIDSCVVLIQYIVETLKNIVTLLGGRKIR